MREPRDNLKILISKAIKSESPLHRKNNNNKFQLEYFFERTIMQPTQMSEMNREITQKHNNNDKFTKFVSEINKRYLASYSNANYIFPRKSQATATTMTSLLNHNINNDLNDVIDADDKSNDDSSFESIINAGTYDLNRQNLKNFSQLIKKKIYGEFKDNNVKEIEPRQSILKNNMVLAENDNKGSSSRGGGCYSNSSNGTKRLKNNSDLEYKLNNLKDNNEELMKNKPIKPTLDNLIKTDSLCGSNSINNGGGFSGGGGNSNNTKGYLELSTNQMDNLKGYLGSNNILNNDQIILNGMINNQKKSKYYLMRSNLNSPCNEDNIGSIPFMNSYSNSSSNMLYNFITKNTQLKPKTSGNKESLIIPNHHHNHYYPPYNHTSPPPLHHHHHHIDLPLNFDDSSIESNTKKHSENMSTKPKKPLHNNNHSQPETTKNLTLEQRISQQVQAKVMKVKNNKSKTSLITSPSIIQGKLTESIKEEANIPSTLNAQINFNTNKKSNPVQKRIVASTSNFNQKNIQKNMLSLSINHKNIICSMQKQDSKPSSTKNHKTTTSTDRFVNNSNNNEHVKTKQNTLNNSGKASNQTIENPNPNVQQVFESNVSIKDQKSFGNTGSKISTDMGNLHNYPLTTTRPKCDSQENKPETASFYKKTKDLISKLRINTNDQDNIATNIHDNKSIGSPNRMLSISKSTKANSKTSFNFPKVSPSSINFKTMIKNRNINSGDSGHNKTPMPNEKNSKDININIYTELIKKSVGNNQLFKDSSGLDMNLSPIHEMQQQNHQDSDKQKSHQSSFTLNQTKRNLNKSQEKFNIHEFSSHAPSNSQVDIGHIGNKIINGYENTSKGKLDLNSFKGSKGKHNMSGTQKILKEIVHVIKTFKRQRSSRWSRDY